MASAHSTHMHALWVNFFKKVQKMESGGFLTQKIIFLMFIIHNHHQAEASKNT